jgi:hypothetical protein
MCRPASRFLDFASMARPYSLKTPVTSVFVFFSDGSLGWRRETRAAAFSASPTTSFAVAAPSR